MKKKISIAIPIFNEFDNLKILIPELIENIKIINNDFEIILVNDLSTDDSLKFCNSLIKHDLNYEIKVINLTKKSRQSGAFKEAFRIATGDFIIKMDSDTQDHPQDIKLFIQKINENNDVIVGDRVKRKHSYYISLAGKIFDIFARIVFQSPLKVNNGSFAAFKKKYVSDLPWYTNDHRYLAIIALKRGAKSFCNIPVTHRIRRNGLSNYNTSTKLIKGIPEVLIFTIKYFLGKYN